MPSFVLESRLPKPREYFVGRAVFFVRRRYGAAGLLQRRYYCYHSWHLRCSWGPCVLALPCDHDARLNGSNSRDSVLDTCYVRAYETNRAGGDQDIFVYERSTLTTSNRTTATLVFWQVREFSGRSSRGPDRLRQQLVGFGGHLWDVRHGQVRAT